jgi:hypothetical protein
MAPDNTNPFAGVGGSYVRHEDGTVEQVEAPTADHPEGNRPRPADDADTANQE